MLKDRLRCVHHRHRGRLHQAGSTRQYTVCDGVAASQRLERVVLSERGLDALAGTLAALIGAGLLVFDARGGRSSSARFAGCGPGVAGSRPSSKAAAAARGLGRSCPPTRTRRPLAARLWPPTATAAASRRHPRPPRRWPEAWLVAIKDSGPLSDFDRLTLHQAVTIVALELLRGRVAGDTERRLAGDVLAAVVDGELAGAELARRLEPFGLAERVAAIVVRQPHHVPGTPPLAPAEEALALALREESAPGWSPARASSPAAWSMAATRRSCLRSVSAWQLGWR